MIRIIKKEDERMKGLKALAVMLVCVGFFAFAGDAAAGWEWVYSPSGQIVAYKDTSTGYLWWHVGSYKWSEADAACRTYYGGKWSPGQIWQLPTPEQLKGWYADGGLGKMMGGSCYEIWTNKTEFTYSRETNIKENCARLLTTCGGQGELYWGKWDWFHNTLCVYAP
jgi:hypothetical protein